MVVQQRERNEADQRGIEWAICELDPPRAVYRYTLQEIARLAHLTNQFALIMYAFPLSHLVYNSLSESFIFFLYLLVESNLNLLELG